MSKSRNNAPAPFDEARHNAALKTGSYQYFINPAENSLLIIKRQANSKGNGFGTAVMREMFKLSLEHKLGNIKSDTSWSSHLFHLYMGMIPINRQTNLVQNRWGMNGRRVIKELAEGTYEEDENEFKRQFSTLNEMLQFATHSKKNFTKEEIFNQENIDLLLALNNKTCFYLQDEFIPMFLDFMEIHQGEKFPDTKHWGDIPMHLSAAGIERWKQALDQNLEFQTFKNFEQLKPFLNEEQKGRLAAIIEKRNAASAIDLALKSVRFFTPTKKMLEEQFSVNIKQTW